MSMDEMRLQLSYMPQDDILYTQLTMQQMLCYSAMLRCPGAWTQSEKIERVNSIMNTLGLSSVADNKVFSVSGGQRKRASAAVEFLSGRPLLFMDGMSTTDLDTRLTFRGHFPQNQRLGLTQQRPSHSSTR